jgi:hypothetical protein
MLTIPEINERCKDKHYIPVAYDAADNAPVYADLSSITCFCISGAEGSGKTSLLRAVAVVSKMHGLETFVFDGMTRDMEGFASEYGATYLAGPDELLSALQNTIIPLFLRQSSEQVACIFINDMSAFCMAVYSFDSGIKDFIENTLFVKDKNPIVKIFACISPGDHAGEWGMKPLFRKFIEMREGLHLGGSLGKQHIFDFGAALSQGERQMLPGEGHIVDNGVIRRISVVTL